MLLEVNAHPERLDLDGHPLPHGTGEGVLMAVNSDTHSTADLENGRYGIAQARRGWLSKVRRGQHASYGEAGASC